MGLHVSFYAVPKGTALPLPAAQWDAQKEWAFTQIDGMYTIASAIGDMTEGFDWDGCYVKLTQEALSSLDKIDWDREERAEISAMLKTAREKAAQGLEIWASI